MGKLNSRKIIKIIKIKMTNQRKINLIKRNNKIVVVHNKIIRIKNPIKKH